MTTAPITARRIRLRRISVPLLAATAVMAAMLAGPAGATTGGATISAHMVVNSVNLNQTAEVTGTVVPGSATPRVVVQRGVGGHWSDRQAGPVAGYGSFTIGIRPSQAGIYALRVRSNGGSVDSPTFYLRVKAPPCTVTAVGDVPGAVALTCLGAWGLVTLQPDHGDDVAPAVVHWIGTKWVEVDCDPALVPPTILRGCQVS